MSKINIIDRDLDRIWDKYINSGMNFELGAGQGGKLPYHKDMLGWRAWHKEHIQDEIIFWGPGQFSSIAMKTACKVGNNFSVMLPGYVKNVKELIKCDKIIKHYICAAKFIGMQLTIAGVKPEKIRYRCPKVELCKMNESLEADNFQFEGGPLIGALSRGDDRDGIEEIIWASAIVQYIDSRTRLVIVGQLENGHRERIIHQAESMAKGGLLVLHENENDWDTIVSLCDVIVSPFGALENVMRLKHCLAAKGNFVAASKLCNEFISGQNNVKLIKDKRARYVAAAITEFCGI